MNFLSNNNSTNNFNNKMDICQPTQSLSLNLRHTPNTNNQINYLINTLLYGSYAYVIISAHFKKKSISLIGLSKLFKKLSDEKRQVALELIEYQQTNDISVVFKNIDSIIQSNWSIIDAMKNAINFEKKVKNTLENIKKSSNLNLSFFLQKFNQRQNNVLNQLNVIFTECQRCAKNGTNKFVFDRNLLNKLN